MNFDVVIVGAGPSGLTAAIRLAQLALDSERELSICILEKGAEVGAHILSGAVIETRSLDELTLDFDADGREAVERCHDAPAADAAAPFTEQLSRCEAFGLDASENAVHGG